jgi:polyferredoxin
MMKKSSFLFKRRAAYLLIAALFFAVPFINIGGLPLLRFDLSELEIYFAGGVVTSSYIFTALLFIFAFLFLFIYITQVFGRIWCGWICPQALSLEIIPLKDTRKKNPKLYLFKRIALALLISFLATCGTIRYTIDFPTFTERFAAGSIHFAWWLLAVFIFSFILWGRKFCTTVCPYSMFQSIMFDNDTLRIGFIPETAYKCIECGLCAKVCPAEIDIRDGLSSKCVSCAACVDACSGVMLKKNERSLVGYFFGDGRFKPFKVNKLITLIIGLSFLTISFLTFFGVATLKVAVDKYSSSTLNGKTEYNISLSVKNDYAESAYIKIFNGDSLLTDFTISGKDSRIVGVVFSAEENAPLSLKAQALRGRAEESIKIRLR